ncbi:MAG TPA: hypothetical protein VK957_02860, partial [Lunatimonas sp.]|nr:hypothetical protein [Lunatimonas sp.]
MEEPDEIQALLSSLFGNLDAHTSNQKKEWEASLPLAASALLKQDLTQIQNQSFTIDKTDLFYRDRADPQKLKAIDEASKAAVKAGKVSEMKVFVREVPVRSTQLPASVPLWAAGSKPSLTSGPFKRTDGRTVFLDFFAVQKMLSIYQPGNTSPALLFTVTVGGAKNEYKLVKGSVWVRADLLAPNAPNDRYFGLAVKDGTISLSANPVIKLDKLYISANTKVVVKLNIEGTQPKVQAGVGSYGKDAADMKLQLPKYLNFFFTGSSVGKITEAADAEWQIYGGTMRFSHLPKSIPVFNSKLSRVMIPYRSNQSVIGIKECKSPYLDLKGEAPIVNSWWAIPAAIVDISQPLEASSPGAMAVLTSEGLRANWQGQDGKTGHLKEAFVMAEFGRISITDLSSNWLGVFQEIGHWNDDFNPHGTSVALDFQNEMPFIYNSLAEGTEVVLAEAHAEIKVDRPVQVNGLPVVVKTKHSVVVMAASEANNLLYLFDDNVLWDNKLPFDKVPQFKTIALALENALFSVSPVNGGLLFGKCNEDWTRITDSHTFLIFGLISYMPTLPDPYVANLGWLRERMPDGRKGLDGIKSWLACHILQESNPDQEDTVSISFHFGDQFQSNTAATSTANAKPVMGTIASSQFNSEGSRRAVSRAAAPTFEVGLPNYEDQYEKVIGHRLRDYFALLDVSSNANQLGISMGMSFGRDERTVTGLATHHTEDSASITAVNGSGLMVQGMQVFLPGIMTRLFTMPQIAWEPVINLTPPTAGMPGDPPFLFNYYPDDGGPTRFINNSNKPVVLAPIPLSEFILEEFGEKKANVALQFTLPFGLRAWANLTHNEPRETIKPKLEGVSPSFPDGTKGGIQISALAGDYGKKPAGEPHLNDLPMFAGFTVQINNVLNMSGVSNGASTLGQSVTKIFNGEFFVDPAAPNVVKERGVPVSRADFTGYGASIFSNWVSPSAAIAETSQARFDVLLGRTAHEVIQVKSLVYPWGIRVVRTITLFRVASGYVYRTDSGWQPESDGLFDFRYKYNDKNDQRKEVNPYELHPGVIKGLFNIKNIREDGTLPEFNVENVYNMGDFFIDEFGDEVQHNSNLPKKQAVNCVPVWFDADVAIENIVQGHTDGKTPAKKILGYVQLAPAGLPLSAQQFQALLALQGGIIGGDIDCVADINNSGHQMRISRFDITASVGTDNNSSNPIFVVSARGSVLLPKDGSWTMVQHNVGTGDVTPLPAHLPVPIIREGKWKPEVVIDPVNVNNKLVRIANPRDLLRVPVNETLNYGFLQSTATQKALFLTPSYKVAIKKLLSKTPPVFADAYKLMTSNGIFPNVGNAIDNFGSCSVLFEGVDANGVKNKAFLESNILDGGKNVLELMQIDAHKEGQAVVEQGFKLLAGEANSALNKAIAFDVPDLEVDLVNMDSLRIYIEYKTKSGSQGGGNPVDGKLNFDIQSFSNDLSKTWNSRMNNVGMVVDLGSFKRLMTIKGNFDAQKGKESGFEGDLANNSAFGGLPVPEVEFSDELKPVIEILQLLASLSTGDYGDIMKRGLKIAMGNAGEIWEYKFEATKEIPMVRFPP